MHPLLLSATLSIGLCLAPVPQQAPTEDATRSAATFQLTFGVSQTNKATEMYRKCVPTLEYLQESLSSDVDIRLRLFKGHDQDLKALLQGELDFVRFGPASYVPAKRGDPKIGLMAREAKQGRSTFRKLNSKRQPLRVIARIENVSKPWIACSHIPKDKQLIPKDK